ncbi:MAG: aldehyde ferredoxin oxidoreductase C-terminal domain-containing protein, partial [Moorellales bacterium]
EFETIYSFGTNLGIDYIPAIIAADRLADELGLDSISAGVTVGLAMELYERGIIDRNETGGLELHFGNHRALMELLRQMAYREGFGAVLADGSKRAAQTIGRGAEAFALHIKGLELPAYDVRGAKAHGLNYCTSYTGADHNRGYAFQEIFGVPVPQAVDRLVYEGKGELCKWNQDVRAATCDCPPTCAFLLDTALAEVALENTASLINAASGLDLTPEQVERVGERLNNLARVYNLREGFTREDDLPPRRLMEEAIPGGTSAGEKLAREDVERMLDEYYRARGWDERGVPTRKKLEELGLAEAVKDLVAMGLK